MFRKSTILLALVAALSVTTPSAVAAPADRAAETRAKVAAYLAANPGGSQLNDTEIAYGGGVFVVTVVAAGAGYGVADCPSGWFCFYDGVNYTYPRGKLSSCGWQDLGDWGWRNRIASVHYNMSTGAATFLNETGDTDTALFTASTTKRKIADVYPHRDKADYVHRTRC